MHKIEMNRSFRNSAIGGGKNFPLASQHRRGLSHNGASNKEPFDDSLDLFSRSRRSVSAAASDDESDVTVPVKLGRLSLGSAMPGKNGLDDLFSSSDEGKHDYDWLLTPPGTPLVPSSNGNESQPAQVAPTPRGRPLGRSVSAAKASRLSVSQSENSHPVRPTRNNSVTLQSISSSSQYNTYSNKSSNILNTSSASVSSYIRPSTPTSQSSSSARSSTRSSSSARPSTPTSRPTLSRPSTPSRAHPSPSTPSRPSQSSRPSTPSSRPQIPAASSSPASRSTSRPSTPTRRNSIPSISPASSGHTVSNGRTVASRPSSPSRAAAPVSRPSSPGRTAVPASRPSSPGRTPAAASRPSSPGPPVRRTPQPIVPPDFSLETPSNLRTSLPDRPLSAGRSRPGAPSSTKGVKEIPNSGNLQRRHSSPIVSRGRLTGNGHVTDAPDTGRGSRASQLPLRKPVRSTTESVGFGGTISKKSLDVAIRNMDIRNGPNGVRQLSGSTLFPHSIRSNGPKSQQSHVSSSPASLNGSVNLSNNSSILEKGNYFSRSSENTREDDRYRRPSARVTDVDIYESSRYDMLLLKEDVKDTNWLHSIDDKSDAMFDNGFEHLPEPFDPLL